MVWPRPGRGPSSAVISFTLAMSANLLARAAGDVVAMAALPFAAATPAYAPAGVLAAPSGEVAPDVRAILARNVFDFTTGALPKAESRTATRPVQRTGPPASCDGSLRLVGS